MFRYLERVWILGCSQNFPRYPPTSFIALLEYFKIYHIFGSRKIVVRTYHHKYSVVLSMRLLGIMLVRFHTDWSPFWIWMTFLSKSPNQSLNVWKIDWLCTSWKIQIIKDPLLIYQITCLWLFSINVFRPCHSKNFALSTSKTRDKLP